MSREPATSQPIIAASVSNGASGDRWLTIAEAASYLKVCQNKLRGVLHSGKIKAVKLGRHYRIDRIDLDNWLIRQKQIVPPYRKGTRPWVADRHAAEREAAQ
jgi:excisionase family DNA binding protein